MPKTADLPTVPSLESDADYAALLKRQREMEAEQAALSHERSDLISRLGTAPSGITLDRSRRVAEILGDDPGSVAPASRARLGEISRRQDDLRLAGDELKRRLQIARHRASQAICRDLEPRYRELVAGLAEALKTAHRANVEYRRFAQQLEDAGIAWVGTLMPMHPTIHINNNIGPSNDVGLFLREAARYGYIDPAAVPEDLDGVARVAVRPAKPAAPTTVRRRMLNRLQGRQQAAAE
jgi:hypothetical protein